MANLQSVEVRNSRTCIVALHCSLGSGKQWSSLIEACGSQYLAVALDISGYGKNAPWNVPALSRREYEAEYLYRDVDALPHPIHLVGHSFGAAIAFELATGMRYARCVRSLTLIEPVLPSVLLDWEPDRQLYEWFAEECASICRPIWFTTRCFAFGGRSAALVNAVDAKPAVLIKFGHNYKMKMGALLVHVLDDTL